MFEDRSILTVQSLACIRANSLLFKNLSFSVAAGDVLQIVGANGTGKSSLLRILSGLLQPDSGQFYGSQSRFYLGHQLALKKEFTVEENLIFDCRYSRPTPKAISDLLDEVGLLSTFGKKTQTLSQGQQQRLALAKCLLAKAKLWLLDEPFAALDAMAREQWQSYMIRQVQQGGAVIFSSHFPFSFPQVSLKKVVLPVC